MATRQNNKIIGRTADYPGVMQKKYGTAFQDYRKRWELASQFKYCSDYPLQIDIDTADACNLACKFCNSRNNFPRTPTNKKMPGSLIQKIFHDAVNSPSHDRLCAVNIGNYGEPLINTQLIPEILSLAHEAGVMETFLHTNGQLLTENVYKTLVDGDLTHILISLDTLNPDTYRELRGGDLQKVLRNLDAVFSCRDAEENVFPLIHISFMNSPSTHGERNHFVNFWKDKVNFVEIQTFTDWFSPVSEKKISVKCPQPWQRLAIDTLGNIIPCCAAIPDKSLEEHNLGSLDHISLFEAWNGQKMNRLRKTILSDSFEGYQFCHECHLRCQK